LGLLAGTPAHQSHTTVNKGHGRIEKRTIQMIPAPHTLTKTWSGLSHVGVITRVRTVAKSKKTSIETTYFITSLHRSPGDILALNRAHWSIENHLHRQKDVLFLEDFSSIRKENAPHNMAIFRATALAFLKSLGGPATHLLQHFTRNHRELFQKMNF
jgi:predicted transposase YbfD/YdcC